MGSQIEQWFRLADEDRDGGVGGAEAVKFFTKSGLPQDVLGQIWEYASGGGAKLNMMQFGVAMRLVALAQASGNRLDPNQARMIAMGGGPQLPPPRLAGVTDAPAPSIATYTPQVTGLGPQGSVAAGPTGAPYVAQPTGGYVPQVTGAQMSPMPGAYGQPQMTGMRPPMQPQVTGMQSPSPIPFTPQPAPRSGPPSAGYPAAGSGPPSGGVPAAMSAAAAGPTGPGLVAVSAGVMGPGMPVAAGPTGGIAGLPGFPPVTPADMQRYQATFMQTDTDRDGLVKGAECFPVFMLSGLDKALLKRMWDMVAGNAGSLNAEQFFKCMYIMDGCRRGAQLPAALPPGRWPQVTLGPMPTGSMSAAAGVTGVSPMSAPGSASVSANGAAPYSMGVSTSTPLPAESWSLDNQFGPKGAQKAVADAYDQTLPKIPDLPGKFLYDGKPPPITGPSLVPDLDASIADMLAPADKARWEAERQEALDKENKQKAAEAEAAAAKAHIEAYQQALSEIVMFKSRVDVALLQASDTAARLKAEAEDTEVRYNRARLAAQTQEEEGNAARQKLQALLARKQEAVNKLELLQQELAMMQNMNPAELAALEKEVGKLVAEAAAAESKKAAMEMQLDSGKKQKALLADRITDLEMAAAAGEGDIRRAREELEYLQAKVSAAQDSALSPSQLGEVGPLLGKAASAYRRLYSSAAAAGIEVPYEANLNNVGSLVWLEQLMAGAADWVDDDSLVSGYTVVNALPDLEGVPQALLRAAALAAEELQPVKPAAVVGPQAAAEGDKAQQKEAVPAANDTGSVPAADRATDGVEKAEAAVAEPAAVAVEADGKQADSSKKDTIATVAVAAATAAVAGTAAAAAAGSTNEPAGDTQQPTESPPTCAAPPVAKVPAADTTEPVTVVGNGESAVGFEDNAFGDSAFGDSNAFPAAAAESLADVTETADVVEQPEAVQEPQASTDAVQGAEAATAPAPLAEPLAAAPAEDLPPSASEAAVVFVDDLNTSKFLADEDDSDIGVTSPFSPEVMSAAPQATVGLGLAGFDPAMYRLSPEQQQLGPQHSVDSSYAGSFAGHPTAGATGASSVSGFEDDAFEGSSSTGQHKDGKETVLAFEDNAF